MTAILMAAAAISILMAGASSVCYAPRERRGRCPADAYRLPSALFGTRTTYAHGNDMYWKRVKRMTIRGCEARMLILFMRHAATYPSKEDIRKMAKRLPEIRNLILKAHRARQGRLCTKHVRLLRKWRYRWKESFGDRVMPSGIKETRRIASRFRRMFPTLLPSRYKEEDYSVTVTSKLKTQDTAKAFLKEILRRRDFRKFRKALKEHDIDDDLLSFDDRCKEMLKEKRVNSSEPREKSKFWKRTEISMLVKEISRRIGVNVSADDVQLIAKTCAFEVAKNRRSPFCFLFDKEDLDLLEYAEDIGDYEEDAHGNAQSVASGCVFVDEMVDLIREKLRAVARAPQKRHSRLKAALYFTHAGPMKRLVARLGLGLTQPPMTAENYCRLKDKRKWRSSRLCPFGANFALVLFACRRGRMAVLPLLNEKEVSLPGCKGGSCPVEDFFRSSAVQASTKKCELKDVCSSNWTKLEKIPVRKTYVPFKTAV